MFMFCKVMLTPESYLHVQYVWMKKLHLVCSFTDSSFSTNTLMRSIYLMKLIPLSILCLSSRENSTTQWKFHIKKKKQAMKYGTATDVHLVTYQLTALHMFYIAHSNKKFSHDDKLSNYLHRSIKSSIINFVIHPSFSLIVS